MAVPDDHVQKFEILSNQVGFWAECGAPDNVLHARGCVGAGRDNKKGDTAYIDEIYVNEDVMPTKAV